MKSLPLLLLLALPAIALADPVGEMGGFSVFGKADLAQLAKGDIQTAASPAMNSPRYLSVQSCFVVAQPPAQVIKAMKQFDPTAHRDLKVYLHADLPASPAPANFAKLNSPPGNSAVR